MALTLADLLTSLAYRLGEDSSPTDASEKARRIRFINEGYRKVISSQPFWFSEASTTLNTVANQEAYTVAGGFPSDYRDMIELRVDDTVHTAVSQLEAFGVYDSDYRDLIGDRYFIYGGNELHILPIPDANGTNNITMRYYKYPTTVSSDSDTFIIPDFYLDALVAYAYSRLSSLDGKRGDASDGFNEFNEILQDMTVENNRQKFYGKSIRPVEPYSIVE